MDKLDERELFEAWAKALGGSVDRADSGEYRSAVTEAVWNGWKARVAVPARPSDENTTARDAARYRWLRDVASHEWLATGPITDASVNAALSSTPAQGDDGATGADLPNGVQR